MRRTPSPRVRRWGMGIVSSVGVVLLGVFAVRHFATTAWPLSEGHPAALLVVGVLLVLAQVLKALGWSRLFALHERPATLALAAGNGGAALVAVVLPGRFDEAMRIAVVRRYPGCPAGIPALMLSLLMLGLVDSVALAPVAAVAALFPTAGTAVRAGLAVVAVGGVAAAAAITLLPRLASSGYSRRFRLGRWLGPRTSSLRSALEAWLLVSSCWLLRALALFLLLGTLGLGFSFPLAFLVLCAGAAAAAVPFGPIGSTAAQVGAGATALIASGVGTSAAIAATVSAAALGVFSGAAVLFIAIAWRACLLLGRAWPSPGRLVRG